MTSRLKQIEEYQEQHKKILFKVVDKLEQRISTLEKVIESHAKCIGEIRFGKSAGYNNEQS
jgi:hypothetical protein